MHPAVARFPPRPMAISESVKKICGARKESPHQGILQHRQPQVIYKSTAFLTELYLAVQVCALHSSTAGKL